MKEKDYTLAKQLGIDSTAISNYKGYSRGYLEPGNIGGGYLTGLKVDAAVSKNAEDSGIDNNTLDNIVSYDGAEIKHAYLGQINMETASSFTGPQGNIIGYDFLRNEKLDDINPLFHKKQWDGSDLPIYDSKPLQDALVEYLGTVDDIRFRTVPAAFVTCANKGAVAKRPLDDRPLKPGEGYGVWSAISISIANDPVHHSSMFVEDAGVWTKSDNEDELIEFLESRRNEIAQSNALCGEHANTTFKASYIGFAHTMLKPGEFGTAITVGPYLTMPLEAVPQDMRDYEDYEADMKIMRNLSMQQWLDKMGFKSICETQNIKY